MLIIEIISLLDENHSLAVVVSKHTIGKCTIIIIKRPAEVTVVCYIYCVTHLHMYLHLFSYLNTF